MNVNRANGMLPPYNDQLTDHRNMISSSWLSFVRWIYETLSPLGRERTFTFVDGQTDTKEIDEMQFDHRKVSWVSINYLIQRQLESDSGASLVECGSIVLSYKPNSEWVLTQFNQNVPDDTGIDFYLVQKEFGEAAYSHVTTKWTASTDVLLAIRNGTALTMSSSGTLPSGYTAGTRYYVINKTSLDFELSATKGGSKVTATTNSGTGSISVFMSSGQVGYRSSSIPGAHSIFRIVWRAELLAGKHSSYSGGPK